MDESLVIGVLFLGGCVLWGGALLRLTGVALPRLERVVVGPVLGLATGGWLLYLVASSLHTLGSPAVALTLVVFTAAVIASRFRPKLPSGDLPRWFLVTVGVLVVVLLLSNLDAVLAPYKGGFWAFEHVWSDTPFHSSIITSFAYRDAYPPHYPLALGQPLNYPFLVDFISGALLRHGFGLRGSMITVSLFVQLAFFLGLALVVHRLTSSARAAIVAVGVFFLLGNLGWLAIPGDITDARGVGSWLRDIPWSYTGETVGASARDRIGIGLYLGNPVFLHLLPRRSAAFGMAVGASMLLLLDDLFTRKQIATAVIVGVLAGVLPRVHAHTAIDMSVVALVWFGFHVYDCRRQRWAELRPLALVTGIAGAVALAIALPFLIAVREQTSHFFAFWPGWTGEARVAFTGSGLGDVPVAIATSLWFWIVNAGFLLLLLPWAWLRADDRIRRFYAPFLAIWLIGFLVRTQPWEWDNNNHFVWWQAGTICIVAPLVAQWLAEKVVWKRALAAVSIVGLTLGGVLSFVYAAEHRLQLWTPGDMAFAAHVRSVTPEDAVILTANGHTQPVTGLSGRQTVMGYTGWFSSHGLDAPRYEADVNAMLAGDVARMRRLGVGYVVLGPWEIGQASEKQFTLGSVFDDPKTFDVVLHETFDGREWRLLKLR